jgi:hypothetical protein
MYLPRRVAECSGRPGVGCGAGRVGDRVPAAEGQLGRHGRRALLHSTARKTLESFIFAHKKIDTKLHNH